MHVSIRFLTHWETMDLIISLGVIQDLMHRGYERIVSWKGETVIIWVRSNETANYFDKENSGFI